MTYVTARALKFAIQPTPLSRVCLARDAIKAPYAVNTGALT